MIGSSLKKTMSNSLVPGATSMGTSNTLSSSIMDRPRLAREPLPSRRRMRSAIVSYPSGTEISKDSPPDSKLMSSSTDFKPGSAPGTVTDMISQPDWVTRSMVGPILSETASASVDA